MQVQVRELEAEDFEAVRHINIETQRQYLGAAWERLSPNEQEEHLNPQTPDFEVHLKTGYSFVAVVDSRTVGFLFGFVEPLPLRRRMYISQIAILPEWQNKGIGIELYTRLIERARSTGISEIRALINLDNPASMGLHEKVGFSLLDRKQATLQL